MTAAAPWEEPRAQGVVTKDHELAAELGIQSIPALLIDSLLIEGDPGLRFLDAYVRRQRARQ